ncbi:aureusidin synthase [Gossypium hirsutum]|uniref:Aureusidin synthase n=1 Tax=Gossypium hirsutum TaxID=3635 RepID=A0ABM3B9T2_GOSHI|nr:aureusidin synthase-like [Gossypium hirsutum]
MALGPCKWISTITFAFLLVMFTVTLWSLESNQVQYPFAGDLTKMILGKLEGWSLSKHGVITEEGKRGAKSVGPNMTSCHPSYGRKDLLVDCCPPGFQLPLPFVDFQFPDPQSPLRIHRPAHAVDVDYIAKYDKALSIMKSLPHHDPRSFSRQANLHCLFCTGAYDQQNSNAPLSIHRTWLFFPWHRMMIYFHERILGSLIGDETFALPYWAWDIPQGMIK